MLLVVNKKLYIRLLGMISKYIFIWFCYNVSLVKVRKINILNNFDLKLFIFAVKVFILLFFKKLLVVFILVVLKLSEYPVVPLYEIKE